MERRMSMDGIDVGAVTAWLLARRPDVVTPLTFDVIAGGRSNLTYLVTDAVGARFVLRRPPLHSVLESAHDVAREARLMSALAGSEVPVPTVIGVETTADVNGAPFFVMDHVDGIIARDSVTARALLTVEQRGHASAALVDTLGALHRTDVDAVGLGDLARRDGYVERQLRRWTGQLEKGSTRELPLLVEVGKRLAADVPTQQQVSIVHGDYRLDNLILSPDATQVKAVLDWELCTLGDPLADVGLLHVYWAESVDGDALPLGDMPTVLDGFWSRQQVIDAYAAASPLDLSELEYYIAFGFWKLAIILEGVFQRFTAGAYEHTDDGVLAMGQVVHDLAARAHAAATAVGR
jgi:aminoglycoside phosphotransferase (APT) family kinase protein